DWQDSGIEGIQRFLGRVYRFYLRNSPVETRLAASPAGLRPEAGQKEGESLSPEARSIQRKLHQTIKRVSHDFQGRWHFNTCIAAIMELVNEIYGAEEAIARGQVPDSLILDLQRNVALLLAPMAPYLAHELWEMTGETSNLLKAPWPKYDAALAAEDEIEIPVQVNGKLRGLVVVPAAATEDQIKEAALVDQKVRAAIAGKQLAKIIVVPKKLVNIVVR
ncbi:MAG: class I tRNA ligase family protein, partial [Terriglobales bacterium]